MTPAFRLVPFHDLSEDQIADVAKLHHQILHSLLADLGLPFLQRYYEIVRADTSVIGVCALSQEGEPLGWAVGSSKPEQLNAGLREPLSWFIPQLIRSVAENPGLLVQLIRSVRSNSDAVGVGSIELTYIGVAPSAQGQGLGKALLNAFEKVSAPKYHSIVLSVEEENTVAIQLYTRAGYRIVDRVIEGKFRRHRMEIKISHERIA